jgi:hypothetical protein
MTVLVPKGALDESEIDQMRYYESVNKMQVECMRGMGSKNIERVVEVLA